MAETILITGGTGKFGRRFVKYFASQGWNVIFTSRSSERVEAMISTLPESYKLFGFSADFSKPNEAERLIEKIIQSGHQINHLVNNARSLNSLITDENGQAERNDFLAEYTLDVIVPYELSMTLYKKQKEALKTITNISSQYGVVAANKTLYDNYPQQSPIQYGVAKAALNHLTKELAVRFASEGVRVNCIAYGGVEGRVDEAFQKRYASLSPTGRMLGEGEIAGPLAYLLNDSCSAITGQVICADGGWTLW